MTTRLNIVLCVAVVVLSSCIVLGTISNQPPLFLREEALADGVSYFCDNRPWLGEITDFAVCTEVIYVLFENKGVLDCYSVDGVYLCSFDLALGEKGKSELFVKEEQVFLKSKGRKFFVFENGNYIKQYEVERTEYFDEIEQLTGEKRKNGEKEYQLHGSSIWSNDEEVVVSRPAWLAVFQGLTLNIVGACCLIGIWILLYIRRGYV